METVQTEINSLQAIEYIAGSNERLQKLRMDYENAVQQEVNNVAQASQFIKDSLRNRFNENEKLSQELAKLKEDCSKTSQYVNKIVDLPCDDASYFQEIYPTEVP